MLSGAHRAAASPDRTEDSPVAAHRPFVVDSQHPAEGLCAQRRRGRRLQDTRDLRDLPLDCHLTQSVDRALPADHVCRLVSCLALPTTRRMEEIILTADMRTIMVTSLS
jgi:hypothetical protein